MTPSHKTRRILALAAPAILCAALLGCKTQNAAPATSAGPTYSANQPLMLADTPMVMPKSTPLTAVTNAVAVVVPFGDNHTGGVVTFTQTPDGVQVVADITGLTPGEHAIHIHEFGDLSDTAKGLSAGGHYNPEGEMHGLPTSEHHHPGDMGNLTADADGKAHLEILLKGVTLAGDKDPIIGRSIIIHEKADDGSQPTGNAGGRVGGAVIGVAKAK